MLDALEIRKEIARLEYEESSYPNYAKLANLYTIQDRMGHKAEPPVERRYSAAPPASETINEYGDSDFCEVLQEKTRRKSGRLLMSLWKPCRLSTTVHTIQCFGRCGTSEMCYLPSNL